MKNVRFSIEGYLIGHWKANRENAKNRVDDDNAH